MGGGQGLGPIKGIVQHLDKVSAPLQEIIVCGTNRKLYKKLKRETKRCYKKIHLLGYANNINELMDASDVIITKPGGITSSEALCKNLPMIIVKPIPGQEVNNTDYLTSRKSAIKITRLEEVEMVVENFIRHPHRLREFRQACARISKPDSSLDIAKLLLDLGQRYAQGG